MFDKAKADHAVNFINCLKHTKGRWRGVPFELLPWQDEIIRTLYGTVKENGYRQYNTCYCEIPKKNGKSELAAAIALYMTCGDGEWGAEVYGCASDRQQASIVFDVILLFWSATEPAFCSFSFMTYHLYFCVGFYYKIFMLK